MAATPVKADLDFESAARITNLPNPTAPQQPATKAYVDVVAISIGETYMIGTGRIPTI